VKSRLFASIATAALLAAGCASATTAGNRLRLIYIPQSNPAFPSNQTVNFGVKTLVGYGGSPMQYSSPQLLTTPDFAGTRWLGLTTVIGHDSTVYCNNVTDCTTTPISGVPFTLDDRQMLVPRNNATVYGGSWGSPANGPYTVVVHEYLDSARTLPTSGTSTITVQIIANAAHIREMTGSSITGCTVDCESIKNGNHPDGGTVWAQCVATVGCTPNFNTTAQLASQLNGLLSTATPLVANDTVYARDAGPTASGTGPYSQFNPTNQGFRVRVPACTGGNWACNLGGNITVTSETQDNTNDAHGNPQLKNGFQYNGISFDSILSGDINFPVIFDHLWCYYPTLAQNNPCLTFSRGAGSGMTFQYNRAEQNIAVTPGNNGGPTVTGARANFTFTHNHIYHTGRGLSSVTAGGATVTFNICEKHNSDCIDITGGGNVVTDNFAFDWIGTATNHSDFVQVFNIAGGPYTGMDIERNISVQGDANFAAEGYQCLFSRNNNMAINGAIWQNNICNQTDLNNFYQTWFNQPVIAVNTGLEQTGTGIAGSTLSSQEFNTNANDPNSGVDGTLSYNLFNQYLTGTQGGTITRTPNPNQALTTANYGTVFANFTQGKNPGWVNRALAIVAFTPILNGAAKNSDGTYNGALTPSSDVDMGACWNVAGLVFDHTKSCVAQGTTKAQ
jgi:hypothetical protein